MIKKCLYLAPNILSILFCHLILAWHHGYVCKKHESKQSNTERVKTEEELRLQRRAELLFLGKTQYFLLTIL